MAEAILLCRSVPPVGSTVISISHVTPSLRYEETALPRIGPIALLDQRGAEPRRSSFRAFCWAGAKLRDIGAECPAKFNRHDNGKRAKGRFPQFRARTSFPARRPRAEAEARPMPESPPVISALRPVMRPKPA